MPLTRVRAATDGHLTAFAGVFPCKLLTDSSSPFRFRKERMQSRRVRQSINRLRRIRLAKSGELWQAVAHGK
jgi:hypothetical protein